MTKLFEALGTLMATACLIQIAADPAGALRDIQRGPMPQLARFDAALHEGEKGKAQLDNAVCRDGFLPLVIGNWYEALMQKVFISSVITGYEPVRAAAKEAVELLDDIPIMSERFGARPHSPEKACLSEAENCDVYLLLLGEKYGFLTSDDISVTHAEYRAAREAGRPILAFIQDGIMESAQKAFREEVENFQTGLFRETFSGSGDLKDKVVRGLQRLTKASQASGEGEFEQRLKTLFNDVDGRSSRNEPVLVLAFWPQPAKHVDLEKLEAKADEAFQAMAGKGLVMLRDGYEIIWKPEWMGLKSKRSRAIFCDDGLTALFIDATVEKEGWQFTSNFVPPSRLSQLAKGAGEFFQANSAWCSVQLTGMEHASVAELPDSKHSSYSYSMRSDDGKHYESRKLFFPFEARAYTAWMETQIARMKRKFS